MNLATTSSPTATTTVPAPPAPAVYPQLGEHLHDSATGSQWWRDAVIYQVYPRSFADSNGDGIGDLAGITGRLAYLKDLGVDGVWLSPYYPSPQADAGYDVADYRAVDPLFGTLADLDELIAGCHALGLKFITDIVPNHTSDEHAWFAAALASAPGSPERARYIFRNGVGVDGAEPPNNWRSVFGGPAWTRVPDGQWYLHLFDAKQPDLNWENPEVVAEFEDTLRFWCDRGVDGFRVDVAHGLIKAAGLPDWGAEQELLGGADGGDCAGKAPMWDQPGVHEIYRGWRRVLDSYGSPERMMVAEAWVSPLEAWAAYVRPDEMHQSFDFAFLECSWKASELRSAIASSLAASDTVGAPTTWVLSNHDVVRHVSRLGLEVGAPRPHGIAADDPQPDEELGLRRGRAATALMLALPGAAYLYQGEELGLPEATALPHSVRQDPAFFRSEGAEVGRDGCRVPLPWDSAAVHLGFGEGTEPWLPQPEVFAEYAVDRQLGVAGSTVELYRELLRWRGDLGLGRGSMGTVEGYADDVVAYAITGSQGQRVLVVANLGADAVALPPEAEVLVASGPLTSDGGVPTDTAVWARW